MDTDHVEFTKVPSQSSRTRWVIAGLIAFAGCILVLLSWPKSLIENAGPSGSRQSAFSRDHEHAHDNGGSQVNGVRVSDVGESSQAKVEPTCNWSRVVRPLRFRSIHADKSPWSSYEESLLKESGNYPGEADLLNQRALLDSMDKEIDGLMEGKSQDEKKRMLISIAAGMSVVGAKDEQNPFRVRALALLEYSPPDEHSLGILQGLAISDPNEEIRTAAAVALATWGQIESVRTWLGVATVEQLKDFISAMSYPTGELTPEGEIRLLPRYDARLGSTFLDFANRQDLGLSTLQVLRLVGPCCKEAPVRQWLLDRFKESDNAAAGRAVGWLQPLFDQQDVRNVVLEAAKYPKGVGPVIVQRFRNHLNDEGTLRDFIEMLSQAPNPVLWGAVEALESVPKDLQHLVLPQLKKLSAHADESIRAKASDCLTRMGISH